MARIFNVSADCQPDKHYMVDISDRLQKIKKMVDDGQYFTINRARQYGKTTTLQALEGFLKKDYVVVSLDFQMMGTSKFRNENTFSVAFAKYFIKEMETKEVSTASGLLMPLKNALREHRDEIELLELFEYLSDICGAATKPVVMIIDEVDSAANNQVFLDFLSQLRGYYIKRRKNPTFQSVILAGVYDVKNIKRKIRPGDEHKVNSPWNIAADFLVDMSFSAKDIAGMLMDYERDYHTGMNVEALSVSLYEYTSGYPFLVSRICKLIDERVSGSQYFPDKGSAWTQNGFLEAVKILLAEKNTLFESLMGKVNDYPELKNVLYLLLFQGQSIVYNPDDVSIDMAIMFGFVKVDKGLVVVANRIFETRLYNMFLTLPEVQSSDMYKVAFQNKNQFIQNGRLDMKRVLEKFVMHFDEIYGDRGKKFFEEDGRRYFLLYLRPIINGTGNYYIEARTRNMERTDVIVDYCGEQFIIELKIWYGDAYNTRGEAQLTDYLSHYHLQKGYMLSFNFNKKKEIGVKEIVLGDKLLVEAVV
jgi:hypothetical protein